MFLGFFFSLSGCKFILFLVGSEKVLLIFQSIGFNWMEINLYLNLTDCWVLWKKDIFILVYIYIWYHGYLWPLISCCLYTTIIRQRKKDFGEIEKIGKYSEKNVYVRIALTHLCMCVCVCMCVSVCVCVLIIFECCCLWSCMWLLVMYVCVYNDTCAARQIWGYLLNICVATCRGRKRNRQGFGRIKKIVCLMILTKEYIYHHHCIMKKMNFLMWHVRTIW